ncbi:TLDc domain [Trinorchestia longiramus]|nr:TLDc domain [Trinorchestia longiramus]
MGNSTSYKIKYENPFKDGTGWSSTTAPKKIEPPYMEIAKMLRNEALATEKIDGITLAVITKHLCNDNKSLGQCVFNELSSSATGSSKPPPYLSTTEFLKAANYFIGLISDFDQLKFFIKGYAVDDRIGREQFECLVRAAYELSHLQNPVEFCPQLVTAVVDAAMHNKDSVNVSYLCKWCLQHCHRLVHWMHQHMASRVFCSSYKSTPQEVEASQIPHSSPKEVSSSIPLRSNSVKPGDVAFTGIGGMGSFKRLAEDEKHDTDYSLPGNPDEPEVALAKSLSMYAVNRDVQTMDEVDADTPVVDEAGGSSLTPSLVWLLTCSLPLAYTKHQPLQDARCIRRPSLPVISVINTVLSTGRPRHWEPLYISDRDGLGMNRFEVHVFNYRGPTISIFAAQDQDVVFCLALDEEWKDSKNFWGGDNSCLLQIRPKYRILERGEKLMYFNLNWRGFPTGIQVGDNYESRALTVDKELSQLQHHNMPYKLGSVEVWGCGSHQARENQQEFKKRLAKDVEKRRHVKLTSSEWADHPDRYLLQMAGGTTSYADYKTPPAPPTSE